MTIATPFYSICLSLFLSACSATTSTKTESTSPLQHSEKRNDSSIAEMSITTHIEHAQLQLLSLEEYNTKRCIIGQLSIAQRLLDKALAEHNALMEKDAFISLLAFDRHVQKINCINQYIEGSLGCNHTIKKTLLKEWYREEEYNQCHTPKVASTLNKKHILITETLHDFDQAQVKSIHYPSLNSVLALMKSFPESSLHIQSHTDSKGSASYNDELSKKRAQQVANFFIDNGIKTSKIVIEHQGEKNIRVIESDEVSRVFNRFTTLTLFLNTQNKKSI